MQNGPVAPKDPVMKKPFFYIMQDKDILGDKQSDGTGVQFIYQNDNRLINSAGIVGNVTDEDMLNLLKTTEGFRKLVYAIGVSVTEPSGQEKVRFVYQMYGKQDTYGSGTNLVVDMTTDGMENASHKFSSNEVKKMIERQKEKYGWEFLFIGANIDAVETAATFGIDKSRAVNYHADKKGTKFLYENVASAVMQMRCNQRIEEDWCAEINEDYKARK